MNFLKNVWGKLKKAKAFVVAQTKVSDRFFRLSAVLFVVALIWLCQAYGIYGAAIWLWAGENYGPLGHVAFVILAWALLGGVAYTILDSMQVVPANHFGVIQSWIPFRNLRVMKEGLNFKFPFIDKVKFISLEMGEDSFVISFNLKDRFPLVCGAALQWAPDPDIVDAEGRNVFYTLSEKVICSGIEKAVQATLGEICGTIKDFDKLITERSALRDWVNCKMRLEKLPHQNHDPKTCGVPNCKMKMGSQITTKDLLRYYKTHQDMVGKALKGEKDRPAERSEFEKRYGIDIVAFVTYEIVPSPEANKAFEREQESAANERANENDVKMVESLVGTGVEPIAALNHVRMMKHPDMAKGVRVFSLEGLHGSLANIFGAREE